MSLDTRKVIFFIAGRKPTADELALIARIRGDVKIRTALTAFSPLYGTRLEKADALAGSIPTSYKTAAGPSVDTNVFTDGDVTPNAVAKPEDFQAFPPTVSVAALATAQAVAISADLTDSTGAIAISDLTADSKVTWSSSDGTKATVGAHTGVITGVAAGAATITATYEYATGKTVTDTIAVTCTG